MDYEQKLQDLIKKFDFDLQKYVDKIDSTKLAMAIDLLHKWMVDDQFFYYLKEMKLFDVPIVNSFVPIALSVEICRLHGEADPNFNKLIPFLDIGCLLLLLLRFVSLCIDVPYYSLTSENVITFYKAIEEQIALLEKASQGHRKDN